MRADLVGVVAQLVERLVRNEKVRGSTPLGSTILHLTLRHDLRAGAFDDGQEFLLFLVGDFEFVQGGF